MTMRINPIRLGCIFGLFMATMHACWAALVASDLAQPVTDFVFWAHFLNSPFLIQSFEPLRAVVLVSLTFTVGLVMGTIAGFFWNILAGEAPNN